MQNSHSPPSSSANAEVPAMTTAIVAVVLEYPIPYRKSVVRLAAHGLACRSGYAVGQMPGPELLGVAGAWGKPQLELQLRLARQVEHHHAVGGAIVERHRAAQKTAAVFVECQRALHLCQLL